MRPLSDHLMVYSVVMMAYFILGITDCFGMALPVWVLGLFDIFAIGGGIWLHGFWEALKWGVVGVGGLIIFIFILNIIFNKTIGEGDIMILLPLGFVLTEKIIAFYAILFVVNFIVTVILTIFVPRLHAYPYIPVIAVAWFLLIMAIKQGWKKDVVEIFKILFTTITHSFKMVIKRGNFKLLVFILISIFLYFMSIIDPSKEVELDAEILFLSILNIFTALFLRYTQKEMLFGLKYMTIACGVILFASFLFNNIEEKNICVRDILLFLSFGLIAGFKAKLLMKYILICGIITLLIIGKVVSIKKPPLIPILTGGWFLWLVNL